jgi:DNA-directed RNA polymerase specialized sigma24 family protein
VRAAVWLHVIEQMALREVAACLETSRSTVYRRIQEGMLEMKTIALRAGLTPPS